MDTIIHPETGETINLFSQEGLDTINKFVNTYKKGGNLDDKINNLTNIYTNLQTQFNNIKTYFQKQDGGMKKRLFTDTDMSSSSGSDIELSEIELDIPEITERKTFIDSLPDDIQNEIKSDPWTGSSSGIHSKDDEINLVETDQNFYKFIPEGKAREIDNIYNSLGT